MDLYKCATVFLGEAGKMPKTIRMSHLTWAAMIMEPEFVKIAATIDWNSREWETARLMGMNVIWDETMSIGEFKLIGPIGLGGELHEMDSEAPRASLNLNDISGTIQPLTAAKLRKWYRSTT
jgi:hypothetical protein